MYACFALRLTTKGSGDGRDVVVPSSGGDDENEDGHRAVGVEQNVQTMIWKTS